MTATHGAVAARAASASEKPCLFRAKVQPLVALVQSPRGWLAFMPISDPVRGIVPAYEVSRRG